MYIPNTNSFNRFQNMASPQKTIGVAYLQTFRVLYCWTWKAACLCLLPSQPACYLQYWGLLTQSFPEAQSKWKKKTTDKCCNTITRQWCITMCIGFIAKGSLLSGHDPHIFSRLSCMTRKFDVYFSQSFANCKCVMHLLSHHAPTGAWYFVDTN